MYCLIPCSRSIKDFVAFVPRIASMLISVHLSRRHEAIDDFQYYFEVMLKTPLLPNKCDSQWVFKFKGAVLEVDEGKSTVVVSRISPGREAAS